MKRFLLITKAAIDESQLVRERSASSGMGAVITFSGLVRGMEGDQPIEAIDYESFEKMAQHQFQRLFDELESRWPLESIRLIHRVGRVQVGEASLWVEIIAPHRGEAFAACQHLIDEMKRVVPIWKKPVI